MRQITLNVVFALLIVGLIWVLCLTHADELKPQAKANYPITLDGQYTVTTKDNAVYKDAKINITQLGCFVILDTGYIYIPIDKIKSITEAKHGSENRRDNGRNMECNPAPGERKGQHL